ncbi:MAG: low molecular weight protein-tyrosine-phosphatase [Phototrophicaceae bacterium]
MIGVLFVCLGNICRSPMAEGVFRQTLREQGLQDRFQVDSAGIGNWHLGKPAHKGTLKVLKEHNIPHYGRSRQITPSDFEHFQYILAMDTHNLTDLKQFNISPHKVQLFLDAAHKRGLTPLQEVPDPYYDGRFEAVFDLIKLGCVALLDDIREEQQL